MADAFSLQKICLEEFSIPCLELERDGNSEYSDAVKKLLSYGHDLAKSFVNDLEVLQQKDDVDSRNQQLAQELADRYPAMYYTVAFGSPWIGVGVAGNMQTRTRLAKIAVALSACLHCEGLQQVKMQWLLEDAPQAHHLFNELLQKWTSVSLVDAAPSPSAPSENIEHKTAGSKNAHAFDESEAELFRNALLNRNMRDETVWGPTTFKIANQLDSPNVSVPHDSHVFLALGDLVCMEGYIMMQAHVCNRNYERAPLKMEKEEDFSHTTLAKLEHGEHKRRGNVTIWRSAQDNKVLNISHMVEHLNEGLKRTGFPYKLIPVHVERDWHGKRYNLTGGQGHDLLRSLQDMICSKCSCRLGEGVVQKWCAEPQQLHITYETYQHWTSW
eukprot:Skav216323  [mRNA]  locus=scaffold3350:40621:41775:+ [translate_table: standard]